MKDSADLPDEEARISNGTFNICLKIRRLLSSSIPVASIPVAEPAGESMIRLPKIDVPKFNGNITNWPTFWEQFDVAINSKPKLTRQARTVSPKIPSKDWQGQTTTILKQKHVYKVATISPAYYIKLMYKLLSSFLV